MNKDGVGAGSYARKFVQVPLCTKRMAREKYCQMFSCILGTKSLPLEKQRSNGLEWAMDRFLAFWL